MGKLRLSKEYYQILLEMAECAIQDRITLIDAYRTDHVRFFEQGARYDGAQQAYDEYTNIKKSIDVTVKDFETIKKHAETQLKK